MTGLTQQTTSAMENQNGQTGIWGSLCGKRNIREGETSAREIFSTPLTFCFRTSGPSQRDASANVGILGSGGRKSRLREFPLTSAFGYCGSGELVQVLY